jgi:hypothetical protein
LEVFSKKRVNIEKFHLSLSLVGKKECLLNGKVSRERESREVVIAQCAASVVMCCARELRFWVHTWLA